MDASLPQGAQCVDYLSCASPEQGPGFPNTEGVESMHKCLKLAAEREKHSFVQINGAPLKTVLHFGVLFEHGARLLICHLSMIGASCASVSMFTILKGFLGW